MTNKHWRKYLVFTLFCVAIYFPLFLHLDWQPMNNWDESLFAMRAAYMTEEGKYLRDYTLWVDGGMEHRSTKPPFTTWLQVASMKLLGVNELALRLPIALCALGIVLLFTWFARRILGDIHIGYCVGFVLVTSLGFVREHVSRTGDQDAALAFYMFAGAIAFYLYIEAHDDKKRLGWLAMLTAATIAAVMTKYAFGLLFFPAFLIYAIYRKQLWSLIKRGSTWLALLVVAATVGAWLWHIEAQLPGFVDRAFHHEMADRYTTTYAGHDRDYWYYFDRFWRSYFMPWLLLLPAPCYLIFSKQAGHLRNFSLLMLLCGATLLFFVSSSKTVTEHYDVAAYPPMAVLAGIGLYQLGAALASLWKEQRHRPAAVIATYLGIYFLLFLPYTKVIERVYKPKMPDRTMAYGYLLKKLQVTKPDYKQFTIIAPIYTGQVNYYAGLLNRNEGYHIKISEHPKQVEIGDTIMACETKMIDYLMQHYELKGIETEGKCFLAIATGIKSETDSLSAVSGQ